MDGFDKCSVCSAKNKKKWFSFRSLCVAHTKSDEQSLRSLHCCYICVVRVKAPYKCKKKSSALRIYQHFHEKIRDVHWLRCLPVFQSMQKYLHSVILSFIIVNSRKTKRYASLKPKIGSAVKDLLFMCIGPYYNCTIQEYSYVCMKDL